MVSARPRRDNTLLATVKLACAPKSAASLVLVFGNQTKQTMLFVRDSSSEENSSATLSRKHIPQAIELEWCSIRAHKLFNERAGHWIVNVNETVTEVADPKFVFHLNESPWRVEIPVCNQPSEEVATGIEHIDEATARTRNVIFSFVVLLGVGHKNFVIEIADAEWPITCRKVWINEAVGIYLMKVFIEGVDLACMEICRIQEIVTIGDAERYAFIDGPVNAVVRAVIDGNDRVHLVQRWVPA
jgi:hypothetical protein